MCSLCSTCLKNATTFARCQRRIQQAFFFLTGFTCQTHSLAGTIYHDFVRHWRYSTAEELNNSPSWAQNHIYGGGGSVLDLEYDKPTAICMMEAVNDKDWIDRRTRAILLKFQVLNMTINLVSIITYHYEVLPFEFGLTYERIDTIQLFNFQTMACSF